LATVEAVFAPCIHTMIDSGGFEVVVSGGAIEVRPNVPPQKRSPPAPMMRQPVVPSPLAASDAAARAM
jgi:hypothetical protein